MYLHKTAGRFVHTDADLENAFNFDITDWMGADKGQPGGHQWPRWWYQKSVKSPNSTGDYGFKLSLEGGTKEYSNLPSGFLLEAYAFSRRQRHLVASDEKHTSIV